LRESVRVELRDDFDAKSDRSRAVVEGLSELLTAMMKGLH